MTPLLKRVLARKAVLAALPSHCLTNGNKTVVFVPEGSSVTVTFRTNGVRTNVHTKLTCDARVLYKTLLNTGYVK